MGAVVFYVADQSMAQTIRQEPSVERKAADVRLGQAERRADLRHQTAVSCSQKNWRNARNVETSREHITYQRCRVR